jgi:hypothetical protein
MTVLRLSGMTAARHAHGAAYAHRLRGTAEAMLDQLEAEHDDEVYRRVCRALRFDPLAERDS